MYLSQRIQRRWIHLYWWVWLIFKHICSYVWFIVVLTTSLHSRTPVLCGLQVDHVSGFSDSLHLLSLSYHLSLNFKCIFHVLLDRTIPHNYFLRFRYFFSEQTSTRDCNGNCFLFITCTTAAGSHHFSALGFSHFARFTDRFLTSWTICGRPTFPLKYSNRCRIRDIL